MGQVLFYHLTRSPVAAAAALLLPRALAAGWRVMLRGTDAERLQRLDEALWQGPDEDFLPHGLQGGPQDADQPILLGTGPIANSAQALMLVDGAEPLAGEAEALARVWVLFDGTAPAALEVARAQWKALTARGLHAKYWSEDSGTWQMKTERNAPA